MNTHDDAQFMKVFGMVLGLLVLFTIMIMFLANTLSPASDAASDPLVMDIMLQQLSPVGQSRVAE